MAKSGPFMNFNFNFIFLMFNNLIIYKMKKVLLTAIVIIVAGIITSCNQSEFDDTSGKRVKVNFSSNIVKVTPPITTRMSGNKWESNDSIGIYMFNDVSTDIVEGMKNIKYTTQNNDENAVFQADDVTIFFPDNGDKVRFMSYYPYTASLINDTYAVNVSDQTSQSEIDLLYSFDTEKKYDKKTPDKKVSLVFSHMLTKINIHIKPGEGLEISDIENVVVHFEGFNTKADFDLFTGELSNSADISNITPKTMVSSEADVVSFEAIIIPTSNPNDSKMVFDLKNGSGVEGDEGYIKSDVFTWKFTEEDALVKSTEYTYNVIIQRSGIVVEATIHDWIPGGEKPIIAE